MLIYFDRDSLKSLFLQLHPFDHLEARNPIKRLNIDTAKLTIENHYEGSASPQCFDSFVNCTDGVFS